MRVAKKKKAPLTGAFFLCHGQPRNNLRILILYKIIRVAIMKKRLRISLFLHDS